MHYFGLQRIKAGHKATWQIDALVAMALGLAAVALQIYQLTDLPFPPGSSGIRSVFVGFYPVFLTVQLAVLLWLEILLARSRFIPAMSFVEQPPTVRWDLHGPTVPGLAERLLDGLELPGPDGGAVLAPVLRSVERREPKKGEEETWSAQGDRDSAGGAWSFGGSILTFAFPMILFIVVAAALYVLYTKPEFVPGHRARRAGAAGVLHRGPG